MQPPAGSHYLETDVFTATPQRLQLMLIDGAIRFVARTRLLWQEGKNDQACESLIRAQQIVTQLLAALNDRIDPKLTCRVASIYLFVFRTLVDANLHRDVAKLDEVSRVLEIERETWRQLCEKLGSTTGAAGDGLDLNSHRVDKSPAQTPAFPHLASDSLLLGDMPSGLSLEA
jgi:flagellar protein FliS